MTENLAEKDLELIEEAICRVLRNTPYHYDPVGRDDDDAEAQLIRNEEDRQLMMRLLDQLNSLRAERDHNVLSPVTEKVNSDPLDNINNREDNLQAGGSTEADEKINNEEIIQELRHVKKQNKFTHVVLGILFATSAIWKLSELTMAFTIRNKIKHPLKSLGGIITSKMKEAGTENIGYFPHVHVEPPRLPHMESPPTMPSVNNILNGKQHTASSSNGHPQETQPPLLGIIFPKLRNP